MAVSNIVRERFKERFGCTIEVAAGLGGGLARLIIPKKHQIAPEEMVGRGYVHFGKGINPEEMDRDSRRILRHW